MKHTIMGTSEGGLRINKIGIIALVVVVVIVAFMAYSFVEYICSHGDYTNQTKVQLKAFLGMEWSILNSILDRYGIQL